MSDNIIIHYVLDSVSIVSKKEKSKRDKTLENLNSNDPKNENPDDEEPHSVIFIEDDEDDLEVEETPIKRSHSLATGTCGLQNDVKTSYTAIDGENGNVDAVKSSTDSSFGIHLLFGTYPEEEDYGANNAYKLLEDDDEANEPVVEDADNGNACKAVEENHVDENHDVYEPAKDDDEAAATIAERVHNDAYYTMVEYAAYQTIEDDDTYQSVDDDDYEDYDTYVDKHEEATATIVKDDGNVDAHQTVEDPNYNTNVDKHEEVAATIVEDIDPGNAYLTVEGNDYGSVVDEYERVTESIVEDDDTGDAYQTVDDDDDTYEAVDSTSVNEYEEATESIVEDDDASYAYQTFEDNDDAIQTVEDHDNATNVDESEEVAESSEEDDDTGDSYQTIEGDDNVANVDEYEEATETIAKDDDIGDSYQTVDEDDDAYETVDEYDQPIQVAELEFVHSYMHSESKTDIHSGTDIPSLDNGDGDDVSNYSNPNISAIDLSVEDEGDAGMTKNKGTDMEKELELPWGRQSEVFQPAKKSFKIPNVGVWNDHDIEPHAELCTERAQSLDKLMPRKEWNKLKKPLERRIQVGSHKFTVMKSSAFIGSLFLALSNALMGSEKSECLDKTRTKIFNELEWNWTEYVIEIGDYCGQNLFQVPSKTESTSLMSKFKHRILTCSTGAPLFLLRAAGKAFKFCYILIDANDYDGDTFITSSPQISGKPLLYFLRTGTHPETWFYQHLIPIGIRNFPTSGKFPITMFDVIQLDRDLKPEPKSSEMLNLPRMLRDPVICFSFDNRIYFYRPTRTHDLWSILSELLFQKIAHAQKMYGMAMNMKVEEANYYYYSKARKRREHNGHTSTPKLREQYKRSIKLVHNHWGDIEDLRRLSELSRFSYTLLGLDANGNFFWKQDITKPDIEDVDEVNNDFSAKKLSLFVRLSRNKQAVWFALTESWNYPNDDGKYYEESQFSDETVHRRDSSKDHPPGMRDGSPVKTLASGAFPRRKSETFEPQDSLTKFRNSKNPGGLFVRISELVTGFFQKIRVNPEPEERNVIQLYFRDNP